MFLVKLFLFIIKVPQYYKKICSYAKATVDNMQNEMNNAVFQHYIWALKFEFSYSFQMPENILSFIFCSTIETG